MKPSRVRVVPSESSLIAIEPFDPAVHQNFVATLDRLENLPGLEAIVDSTIFEEGTITGPDRFGIVAFLRERQSTVKALIARTGATTPSSIS